MTAVSPLMTAQHSWWHHQRYCELNNCAISACRNIARARNLSQQAQQRRRSTNARACGQDGEYSRNRR
jgi:hypothetical protein